MKMYKIAILGLYVYMTLSKQEKSIICKKYGCKGCSILVGLQHINRQLKIKQHKSGILYSNIGHTKNTLYYSEHLNVKETKTVKS